ncbi:MAG: hypothetical protein JW730_19175 [Anaerolineales bacterium]|nr:hypothetical protein [Anaerolineales bacterium]
MKLVIIITALLVLIGLLGWLGLQVQPGSFVAYPEKTPELETIPLPAGLPAPVERFYRTVYGDEVPVIETAVMKGRAVMSPFGVKLPARFVFVHNAGRDYRHYIEATWFGIPFLKVDEGYLGGESFFESPMGSFYDDPNTNQGANLAVWAEAGWFPSIWLTDNRVHWAPVDEHTALLYVPFEDQEENFVVRFDPETGLIDLMEAMRFREAGEGGRKVLWITKNEPGPTIAGTKLGAAGSATWLDQGKPWAVFTLEELNYNVDVSKYIRQRGP